MLQTPVRVVRSFTCLNVVTGRRLRPSSWPSRTVSPPRVHSMAPSPAAASITSEPAPGQLVEHEGKIYETVREGRAHILIPPNSQRHVNPQAKAQSDDSPKAQSVFYNPIQQFNRDLSVLAIKAFGENWLQLRKAQSQSARQKAQSRRARKEQRAAEQTTTAKKRKAADADGEAGNGDENAKRAKSEDGTAASAADGAPMVQPGDVAENGEGGAKLPAPNATQSDAAQPVAASGGEGTEQNGDATTNGQPSKLAGPRFRILDALSATGLRALRYAKEIPFVSAVVANDMNPNAITSMKMNVQHNQLIGQITPNHGDAIGHMYGVAFPPVHSHGPKHVSQKYDVIDLDPYGTAAPFIDAALQAINDGGLLCVTCTDSAVFASLGYCEKTYALYGGMPIKGSHMHEGGLRLIINSVATAAARQGIAIEPLLSLSIDFYARVFIRVRRSPADVKFLAGKTMLVYGCDNGCGAWSTNMMGKNTKQESKNGVTWFKHSVAQGPGVDRLCEHCGSKTHIAGPMWGGPIHNAAFIQKVLHDLESADPEVYETKARVEGMLTTALDELEVNGEKPTRHVPADSLKEDEHMIPKVPPDMVDKHPFFFNPSALSKVIHCVAPKDAAIRGALRHLGYIATRSHCQPGSIKTDAPWSAIWDIMREWVRQKQPIKEGALKETQAGWRIMNGAKSRNEATASGAGESSDVSPEMVLEGTELRKNGRTPPKIIFDEVLGKDHSAKKIVRYQQNPRENWGPMSKARGSG